MPPLRRNGRLRATVGVVMKPLRERMTFSGPTAVARRTLLSVRKVLFRISRHLSPVFACRADPVLAYNSSADHS